MKQLKSLLVLMILVAISFPSFGEVDEEELSLLLNVEMVNYNIPGVMVTVVKDGSVYYQNELGEADVMINKPMDASFSVIQTGSISKVFTTYALLDLLGKKSLSVDEPIGPYLPDYLRGNTYIGELTFSNLFTHTTGIATLKANSALQENPLKNITLSFSEQAKLFFDTYKLKPVIEKDEYTIFSNVGYILSGVLLESLSGESYENYMAKKIFEPLGMRTSGNILTHKPQTGLFLIQNYSVFGGQRTPLLPFETKYAPSDDFLTTLDDMTVFLKLITSGDMDQNINDALFSKQIANNILTSGRSYGFSAIKYGKYETYIHDGGIPGSSSRLLVIPELKLGLFLTYNSNSLKAREDLTLAVLSDLISENQAIETHEPYPIEDFSKFTGVFSPVNTSNETMERLTKIIHQIRISIDIDGIKIDEDKFIPISETIFYNEEFDHYAEFRTDENGKLEYLLIGNSIYKSTPFYQSIIFEAAMLLLMTGCNLLAGLLLITRWSNMKVNRIHDTPRMVLLAHSLFVSGILIFILFISTKYDIWDVIYGINSATNGTKFFGYATLIMTIPAFIMINRAKQDYRWSRFMIFVFQLQVILGLFLVSWLFVYNLI